jgi:hypothetical protein
VKVAALLSQEALVNGVLDQGVAEAEGGLGQLAQRGDQAVGTQPCQRLGKLPVHDAERRQRGQGELHIPPLVVVFGAW